MKKQNNPTDPRIEESLKRFNEKMEKHEFIEFIGGRVTVYWGKMEDYFQQELTAQRDEARKEAVSNALERIRERIWFDLPSGEAKEKFFKARDEIVAELAKPKGDGKCQ